MTVSIIGTAGIPARYGGFETLAENLVKNKTEVIEYTVFCSAKLYQEKAKNYLNANLRYINLNANGMSSIFYDFIAMLLSLRSDVMLILGVSGSLFLPFIRLIYQGRIIINIDGIEWKRDKWNKLAIFFLRIFEKIAVRFSDFVICDNQGIIEYITEKYKQQPILIEYGGDNVNEIRMNKQENDFCKIFYAICVCRVEPENNIHLILEAFSKQTEIPLVIVGNWKNSSYGLTLLKKYVDFTHLYLLNPIYDSDTIDSLRSNASIYVHGHSAGGTNPSLVEAMFLGLPVLAFDCVYNRYTTENQGLFWSNVDELYTYIVQYENLKFGNMGKKMKQIAERRYIWNKITSQYEALFVNALSKKINGQYCLF
jgi:glycosyltransferase involved in cell wall biosynthesis